MKRKLFFTIIAISAITISCDKQDTDQDSYIEDTINDKNVINIPSKSLLYDKIYQIQDGKEVDITHKQNLLRSTLTHESYEITPIKSNSIFLGSVLSSNAINRGLYSPVGNSNSWKKYITISYSLPIFSEEIQPKKSEFENAIKRAVANNNFSGTQSQIFTYKMKQFSYYSELKLAFGGNINIGNIFTISGNYEENKTKSVSALFIDFSQTYFTTYMDLPDDGNIFRDEITKNKFIGQKPVYINSIDYGRKGIIMVESDESYKNISASIRASFTAKIVNGELSLSKDQKKTLEEANIQICIIGGDGRGAVKTVSGFKEFQEFIINGGVYTKDIYGVPISFSAAYAEDNSMFITEFQVKYDN